MNEKENAPEIQSGDPNQPVEESGGQSAGSEARVAELEGVVVQRNEELAKAQTRLAELEQTIAGKSSEIASLSQSKDELEARLTTLSQQMAEAVASYKAMMVQANPVIQELISGETIEAINESLEKAKSLVGKVRQGLEAEVLLARIPAGAPERTLPDLSTLSPREKIQYAIGGKR